MARPRRKTTTSNPTDNSSEFTCPECGKTFTRAASLGAHRNRAHGITGTSKRRTRRTTSTTAAATSRPRRRGSSNRRSTSPPAATPNRRQDGQSTVDRDQLLQTLFPNGVPPREDVIKRIGRWLEEAEQLAKL